MTQPSPAPVSEPRRPAWALLALGGVLLVSAGVGLALSGGLAGLHPAVMVVGMLGLAGVGVSLQRLAAGWAQRRWTPWAVALGVVGILVAYLLAAPPSLLGFSEVTTPYHRFLAEALLQGRVSLEPGETIYDLCSHDGKLYLCWGPMPAVLMMPAAWLWDQAPTGRAAGVAVGLVSIATWAGLLWALRRRGALGIGTLDLLLLTAFSMFGTQLWFLSASAEVWHLGQSFAIMLGGLALLCLLPRRLVTGVLASALFGAAALSRFSLMLLFPLFGVMALLLHLRGVRRWRGVLGRGVALALPLFAALGTQLLYNRARYGSLLDFGWRNQLGSDHLIDDLVSTGTLSISYLPRNLGHYLLDPLDFQAAWPFIEFTGHGNAVWSYQLGLFVVLAAVVVGLPRVWPLLGGVRMWLARLTRGPRDERLQALGELPLAPVLLWGSAAAFFTYWLFLLLLFTTGWRTVGCRLLANAQPFLLVLLAFAFARLRGHLAWRTALWALLLVGMLIQTWIKLMMT